jgi:hypothetical protein
VERSIFYNNMGQFIDLGTNVNPSNVTEEEMKERTVAGNTSYSTSKELFTNKQLSRSTKLRLYNTVIKLTVTYECETGLIKIQSEEKLLIFEGQILWKKIWFARMKKLKDLGKLKLIKTLTN